MENGGKIPVGQAMIQAGYSVATAKTPQKLTESEGFKTITEEIRHELGSIKITPKKLARVIKQGLSAKQPSKVIIINRAADGTTVVDKKTIEVPDHAIRHKYLDTTLKIYDAFPKQDDSPASIIAAKFKAIAETYIEQVDQDSPANNEHIIDAEPVSVSD